MKKTVFISVGTVVVVVLISLALVFALGGKDELPKEDPVSLEGNWVIAAMCVADHPEFVQNQTIVFTEDRVAMYKEDHSDPYASSTYSVSEAGTLSLPDMSRQYRVDVKTNNCIRLYEDTTSYMLIIRNDGDLDANIFQGKWKVAMKGDLRNSGERMEFSGNSLNYYKGESETPAASAEFTLSETGILVVEKLGFTMHCYRVSQDTLVFIEQNGVVWELVRT